jgi:hypothetical protein
MRYDTFAQRLESEYSLFLFALSGRYLSLTAPGADVSPALIDELKRNAWALRQTFLATASASMSDYLGVVELDSVKTLSDEFRDELERVTWQNVTTLVTRMKGVKANALDAVNAAHGAMGLLLQRKLATPEFAITALSGRSYSAAPFVKTQARQFAYQSDLRLTMAALSQTSDLAQVAYSNPNHANHGQVFSISGATPGHPSFDDLTDTVFHYNATARIEPYVSP